MYFLLYHKLLLSFSRHLPEVITDEFWRKAFLSNESVAFQTIVCFTSISYNNTARPEKGNRENMKRVIENNGKVCATG